MTEKTTHANAVATHIRQLIFAECMMPNTKLPSERLLSQRLSVSRAIIREALRDLQGRGIIRTEQGRGSFVNGLVAEPDESKNIDNLFAGQKNSLYDLLEVREQLEAQAAFLAAQRANDGDKYRITQAFEKMTTKQWNAQLDHDFHQTILDACHNPVLVHTLDSLKRLTLRSVEEAVNNLRHKPVFRAEVDKQHRRIYRAVINGQPSIAKKAAIAHVRFVSDTLHKLESLES